MCEKKVDFKEYSTVIAVCPDCSRHYALRLNWTFVAARKGQEISVVCMSCAELRINELKKYTEQGSAVGLLGGTIDEKRMKTKDDPIRR
jgi:hypothetical protein